MKYDIPQIKQIDETSCASANYAMVASALKLSYSLKDILQVTKSEIGFIPFWKFLLENNNIEIIDFNESNLKVWAENGFDFFKKEIDGKTFDFLKERITDPNKYQEDLKFLFENESFKFFNQKPNVDLLKECFFKGYVCEVMLDPWLIYGEEPPRYSLHRVFIVDINDNEIIFHDPAFDGEAFYKSDVVKFEKAFQIAGAELVCYKLK